MRHFLSTLTLVAAGVFSLPALAQPPEGAEEPGDRPRGPEIRERILVEFDKDKSGSLDDGERETLREHFRDRFEGRREGRRERAEARDGERREGDRDSAGRRPDRGPERRRGPMAGPPGRPGPPLEPLFKWFDGDNDDKLSREEFAALSDFVRHHPPRRPGGAPDGPRFGRRLDGPPRGEFRRGDRRGPDSSPREEGDRRRGRGDRDGRDRDDLGPEGRGSEGPPGPPPGPDGPPGPPAGPAPDSPTPDEAV